MLTLIDLNSTAIFATGRTIADLKETIDDMAGRPHHWVEAEAYDDAQHSADGRYAVVSGVSEDETEGEAALRDGEIVSYLMSYDV